MNTGKKVIGILLIILSSVELINFLLPMLIKKEMNDINAIMSATAIVFLVVGIVAVKDKSPDSRHDQQEYEEFLRMKEQERRILYRNADYQCKSINEYLMDDRTKLVTYYDRMPQSYKSKLVGYAETLYRNFENEEYLDSK